MTTLLFSVSVSERHIAKRDSSVSFNSYNILMYSNVSVMTPLKTGGYVMEPVRMEDGFQYLNSEDEDDSDHGSNMPSPHWCIPKVKCIPIVRAIVPRTIFIRIYNNNILYYI